MAEPEANEVNEKTRLITQAIMDKKGHRLVNIDLREVDHAICDTFIICHGESSTQVGAITDSIQKKLKVAGIRPHHVEGVQNCQWVLLDYFDVLVHVFLEEFRDFYRLEELWADGVIKRLTE